MDRAHIVPGSTIEVRMSASERDLIVAETFMEPDYMERLIPAVG